MRFAPAVFPCGCVGERRFEDGQVGIWWEPCEVHLLEEKELRERYSDEDARNLGIYRYCSCPGCSLQRAIEEGVLEKVTEAEVWSLIARMQARKFREASEADPRRPGRRSSGTGRLWRPGEGGAPQGAV